MELIHDYKGMGENFLNRSTVTSPHIHSDNLYLLWLL